MAGDQRDAGLPAARAAVQGQLRQEAIPRRSLHRHLDLAGQSAWFTERALPHQLAAPLKVIRLGYFDPRMRDLSGAAQVAARLAPRPRPAPRARPAEEDPCRCTFTLTDDDPLASHPGTFAHHVPPSTSWSTYPAPRSARGIVTPMGFCLLRRSPSAPRVPLSGFADACPVSDFRSRRDMGLFGLPGERLLPCEGTTFTTTWTLELPPGARPTPTPSPPCRPRKCHAHCSSRDDPPTAKLSFALNKLPLPPTGKVINLAVVLPGVAGGSFTAKLRFGSPAFATFEIVDGVAMPNLGRSATASTPTHSTRRCRRPRPFPGPRGRARNHQGEVNRRSRIAAARERAATGGCGSTLRFASPRRSRTTRTVAPPPHRAHAAVKAA